MCLICRDTCTCTCCVDLRIESFTPSAGLSPEDAMSQISAIVGADVITGFGSKKWNECVDALNTFANKLLEQNGLDTHIEPAYYTLNHTPTFKPNNFQVHAYYQHGLKRQIVACVVRADTYLSMPRSVLSPCVVVGRCAAQCMK